MKSLTFIIIVIIAFFVAITTIYQAIPSSAAKVVGITAATPPFEAPTPTLTEANPTSVQISDIQIIKATYSNDQGFQPTQLKAKAGIPIRLEVASSDDGQGCMGSISLPQLSNDYYGFEKGKTVVFNVTPPGPGEYAITCAMGIPHGSLTVE